MQIDGFSQRRHVWRQRVRFRRFFACLVTFVGLVGFLWKPDKYPSCFKLMWCRLRQGLRLQPGTMPFCRSHNVTPLARHAALQVEAQAEAAMPFPMYTVSPEDVLQMSSVEPHETLKAKGLLVEFYKLLLSSWRSPSHGGGSLWKLRDRHDPAPVRSSAGSPQCAELLSCGFGAGSP